MCFRGRIDRIPIDVALSIAALVSFFIGRATEQHTMKFDVLISYPHQDKVTADAVCATLENAGIRCWIAPRNVRPGADWAASIVDAIANCRVTVLIFSSRANQSRQVQHEVQPSFDGGKAVIPFRIETRRRKRRWHITWERCTGSMR
jgi:hypothetical protein